MDKTELKKMLKPLIHECIKEALFEKGILSGIISECIQGVSQREVLNESVPKVQKQRKESADSLFHDFKQNLLESKQELLEARSKVISATGLSPKLFENVIPLTNGGKVAAPSQPISKEAAANAGPLRSIDASDPGVNISGILNLVGGKKTWNNVSKMLDSKKKE